jgi:hypothetical protein
MAFFEPPPPPPAPPKHWRRPEWMLPDNYLGQPVPTEIELARSAKVRIVLRHLIVYPTGIEFQLVGLVHPVARNDEAVGGFVGRPYYSERNEDPSRLPDGLFRFGIQFADGSKATTLQDKHIAYHGPNRPPSPWLQPSGGGGSSPGHFSAGYWVWPLPPTGPLGFVCEWPALGISLTRREIDSGPIRAAAVQTTPLWDEE